MTSSTNLPLLKRKSLDEILKHPEKIISVYSVESHIWADNGSDECRRERIPQIQTVEEFLVNPVRSFLNDILKLMAAPYQPDRRDLNIGQGYWIQADFGSGKSHLLSFLGALAIGGDTLWELIKEKESKEGLGKRESLYEFYENGLKRKNETTKGIMVAVKTLVGSGSGTIGLENADKSLTDHILDTVSEQFKVETGKSLPIYPAQILAKRFLDNDLVRYKDDLRSYLADPKYFDDEEQEDINEFLEDLANTQDPEIQRDCGQKLWNFYKDYLGVIPNIPMDAEEVLGNMVAEILAAGYAGLLLILDEVSLYMKQRNDQQRAEDEEALVVMSNRLTRHKNYPVWTVCAAQQAIESKIAGSKNIIARERLDLVPLLKDENDYYKIALSRVREIVKPDALDQYFQDYKKGFTWVQAQGKTQFDEFFPFYKNSMDVLKAVSYNLTTVRSALYFMLETIKRQAKNKSNELISLWAMFDEVVTYTEDPSGVNRSIANIQTKFPEEWKAYELAKAQISSATKGYMKTYPSRCEKIVKTLFLVHIAKTAEKGLSTEEVMNSVMEWKDHLDGQEADQQDNLDHYEILLGELARELEQIEKSGNKFRFNPMGTNGPSPQVIYEKFRSEAENNEKDRQTAWQFLISLKEWPVRAAMINLDLSMQSEAIFNALPMDANQTIDIDWHKRSMKGRLLMRDLNRLPQGAQSLPNIITETTDEDFMVIISSSPAEDQTQTILQQKRDPRLIIWTPAELTINEQSQLVDFTAYYNMVAEYRGKDDEEAQKVIQWVANQLEVNVGPFVRMVSEVYGRGLMSSLDHQQLTFNMQGNLTVILTPAITQVLDSTYDSASMTFSGRQAFDDTAVINVINGIVKMGAFERGIRLSKEVEASRTFGPTLKISKSGHENELDLSACTYAHELSTWIEEKVRDLGTAIKMDTLVKNFTGINGPNGKNYGLSKRLIQLYSLALVKTGKLRVRLQGRNLPVEVIDYANIGSITFNTAILNAMDEVEVLRPPEGWEVIAPFAAILVEDENFTSFQEDEKIQEGVRQVIERHLELKTKLPEQFKKLELLFNDLNQENPFVQTTTMWQSFLEQNLNSSDAIDTIRYAFGNAFEYGICATESYEQTDLDDFATRYAQLSHIELLVAKAAELRAIAQYKGIELSDDQRFSSIRRSLDVAARGLENLKALSGQPARLDGECLRPGKEAIEAYATNYLTLFDRITQISDEARRNVKGLPESEKYNLLMALETIPQLATSHAAKLPERWESKKGEMNLLSATITREEIQRDLRLMPYPGNCPLRFENAADYEQAARDYQAYCEEALDEALLDKARLLGSPLLKERLSQVNEDERLQALMQAGDPTEMVENLLRYQKEEGFEAWLAEIVKHLRKVSVVKLRTADFRLLKGTYTANELDEMIKEFKAFLEEKVAQAGDADDIILEIED